MFKNIAKLFRRQRTADLNEFRELFERFQQILKGNNRVLELISELEDKLSGEYIFDINYLKHIDEQLSQAVYLIVSNLNIIANNRYRELFSRQLAIQEELNNIIQGHTIVPRDKYIIDYDNIDSDMAEIAGAKSADLGEIRNRLKMPAPEGFVLTTTAYKRFMDDNQLWPEIRKIHERTIGTEENSDKYDKEIEDLFRNARFPSEISKKVNQSVGLLSKRVEGELSLAIRSSAYGEDARERGFAGQFKSFLCRHVDDLFIDYAGVLASRFKHGAIIYGGERIFQETELPMAVAVQAMIAASTSGVAYSVEPSGEANDCLTISSCFGLGVGAVEGITDTDYYRVSKIDPAHIISRRIGRKEIQILPAETKGVQNSPVPEEMQEKPSLTDDQVFELAEHVLMLERYFKRPIDVEWCFDNLGKLFILQCRPLKVAAKPGRDGENRLMLKIDSPVLMSKKGQIAQRGIAAGKIKVIHDDDDMLKFPSGAIAVTRYTSPRLTSLIRKAAAIITDIGSPSGHMATVAREFGVPMIVGTADATQILKEGSEATVDAEENIIYEGIVTELLEYETEGEDIFRDLREYKILRHLLRKIWPLTLVDPNSPDFNAKNCQTYHDIVRFSHEKAVRILIDLNISSQRFRGIESRKLKLEIPLGLQLIDLGGGLDAEAENKEIKSLEKVKSIPMLAILEGLTAPGTWETQPMQLGFGDLVSSLTRYSMTDWASQYKGQNLAVISDHYANISLRLGYHFNVIDTYVSENVDDNYIYFRFVGGVTGPERRHLRATLIKQILERLNFKVTISGDLVVGRLKKWHENEIRRILFEIGRLIGFTRQLDTQMQDEQSIAKWLQAFFNRG